MAGRASDTSANPEQLDSLAPVVRYGLYGVVLGDGFTLAVYRFLDLIQRRLDSETGGQVLLQYPGPPSRSGALHKAVQSPAQAKRARADMQEYRRQKDIVGEEYLLAELSECAREVLKVSQQHLPAIVFFLPAASGESERVIVRIPTRLLTGIYTQRDLANVLCRRLNPALIRIKCPSFPQPGKESDQEKLRTHLKDLQRALRDLAGRSVIEPSSSRGDLSARWVVFTDRDQRRISEEEYHELREARSSLRIFLDETIPEVWRDGQPVRRSLPGSYFVILRACALARGAFDAGAWGGVDREDGKQTFQRARKAIDIELPRQGGRKVWSLFKTVPGNRRALYRFEPAPGFKFALIFLDEDIDSSS